MKSRKTKQKERLQIELDKFNTFFTAEDLFGKVKKKDSKIGIATVYRYLKDLRKKRQLHSYICDRKIIYSKQRNNHCHYTCQKCGKIIHFDVDKLDFLKNEINGSICHFQIDIHGICDKCFNRKLL